MFFCLCGWKGSMRMQSECFGLEVGEASEFLQLPGNRHSAVFYDAVGRLVIRWRQRKNRPQGSYIIRPCDCQVDGPQNCLCCRMKPIIAAGRGTESLPCRLHAREAHEVTDGEVVGARATPPCSDHVACFPCRKGNAHGSCRIWTRCDTKC